MAMALVFITLKPGSMNDFIYALKNIESVEEIYPLYGLYDVLTEIKAETIDAIKEEIGSISRLHIASTMTLMTLEDEIGSITREKA